MKLRTGLILSTSILILASTFTNAYASEEEATRLQELFTTYLTDTEGVVEVKTDGDGYAVKLDLQPLTSAESGTVKITPIEFKMASQGDGKWQIIQDQPLSISIDLKDQGMIEEKIGSLKVSGIFDENLSYFSKASGEATDVTVNQKMDNPGVGKMDMSASVKTIKIDQTGVAADNGGVDIASKYEFGALTETINTAGKPDAGVPPMNLVINGSGGNYDLNAKGLKANSVFDVLSFFVAYQTKELISKNQDELKTALKDGVPLWENILVNAKLNGITVSSQFGQFSADAVEVVGDVNGIVKDGKFREKVAFKGLTVPAAIIPPWATQKGGTRCSATTNRTPLIPTPVGPSGFMKSVLDSTLSTI